MTPEELQAIRDRVAKASPGPWTTEQGEYSGRNWPLGLSGQYGNDVTVFLTTDHVHASEMYGDAATDGDFIAHARTDIPALLAEIDRLNALVAAAPRWIKVADRLPEDRGVVPVLLDNGHDGYGFYNGAAWVPFDAWRREVTHWLDMSPAQKAGE
jgi:hypothetical protein